MDIILGMLILGGILIVVVSILYFVGRARAKTLAKKMITARRIDNIKDFNLASNTLAKMPDDLEAADLWKKLQALKDSSSS